MICKVGLLNREIESQWRFVPCALRPYYTLSYSHNATSKNKCFHGPLEKFKIALFERCVVVVWVGGFSEWLGASVTISIFFVDLQTFCNRWGKASVTEIKRKYGGEWWWGNEWCFQQWYIACRIVERYLRWNSLRWDLSSSYFTDFNSPSFHFLRTHETRFSDILFWKVVCGISVNRAVYFESSRDLSEKFPKHHGSFRKSLLFSFITQSIISLSTIKFLSLRNWLSCPIRFVRIWSANQYIMISTTNSVMS